MMNLPVGWIQTKIDDISEILDKKRIPVNVKVREQRIAGKNRKDLFPYYGATGQVGWIDNYIFNATGTAQKTVSLAGLRNITVVICSIKEQNAIVHEIESLLSTCDNLEQTMPIRLDKSFQVFFAIIP